MRSRFTVIPILLALVLATGCALKRADGSAVPVEINAALRATQLVGVLDSLTVPAGTSPVELLVDTGVITAAEGIDVATVIRQAHVHALDLAHVLTAVHEARDEASRRAGLERAAVLVREIARGLQAAPLSIGTPDGRKAVFGLISVAADLLITVGTIFPAPAYAG